MPEQPFPYSEAARRLDAVEVPVGRLESTLEAVLEGRVRRTPVRWQIAGIGALTVFAFTASLAVIALQTGGQAKGWKAVLQASDAPEFAVCRVFVVHDDGTKTPHFTKWMSKDATRTEVHLASKKSVTVVAQGIRTTHDLNADKWTVQNEPTKPNRLEELARPVDTLAEIGQGRVVSGPMKSQWEGADADRFEVETSTQEWTVWTDPKSRLFIAMEVRESDPARLTGGLTGAGHRLVLYEYPKSLPKSLFELKKP